MINDSVSRQRQADEAKRLASAQHFTFQSEVRLEQEAARTTIAAMTDAHQSFLEEAEANASKDTQLRAEMLSLEAQNEHNNQINLNQIHENESLHERYDQLAHEANARIAATEQRSQSAIEDQRKTHDAQVATTKTTYDHHIEDLTTKLGD